jgi:hypothetical protein
MSEEELVRLEARLDELERQRLSRFDNVFFLTYPVIILVMSWLSNALWQAEIVSSYRILGTSLSVLLTAMSLLFLMFVVLEFVAYVHAYYNDNLAARIVSSANVAGGVIGVLGVGFAILFPERAIDYLIEKHVVPQLSSAVVLFLWGFSAGFLSRGYVFSGTRRLLSVWFRQNVPLLVSRSNGREAIIRWCESRSRPSTIEKILWFGLCLSSYAVAVALIIRAEGHLCGETVVHYWVLVALIVGTIIVLGLRSKGGSKHLQH